jgi:hypothetical protein
MRAKAHQRRAAQRRVAAAILGSPAVRSTPMARLRKAASTWGRAPARTVERRRARRPVCEPQRLPQRLPVIAPPLRHRRAPPAPAQRRRTDQAQDRPQGVPFAPRQARVGDLCYNLSEWMAWHVRWHRLVPS